MGSQTRWNAAVIVSPLTSLEWWFGEHDIALSDGKITAATITSTHVITVLAELEIRIHDAMKDVNQWKH